MQHCKIARELDKWKLSCLVLLDKDSHSLLCIKITISVCVSEEETWKTLLLLWWRISVGEASEKKARDGGCWGCCFKTFQNRTASGIWKKKIRKGGILNVSVMEKGHNLIRERRQGSCNNADLRMCNGCHGFFNRKQIYRHKKCIDLSGTSSGSVNFTKSWRSAESLCVTEEFKSVIDSFRNDESGRLCQSDSLIILLGKRLWAKI